MKRALLIGLGILLLSSAVYAQYLEITIPVRCGLAPAFRPLIATYLWQTIDGSPDPAEVRWIMIPTADFNESYDATIEYIRTHPDASEWSEWVTYNPPDIGTSWTSSALNYGPYVFAVHGRDSEGNANTVFDEDYNVRRIMVSPRTTGPLLTVTGDHIDPIQTAVTDAPPTQIGLANGTPVSFCWTADACAYGGVVTGYRYGWDLIDPEDPNDPGWEIPYTPFVEEEECSPERVYNSGVHTFTVEVMDFDGYKSRASIEITYSPPIPPSSIGIFSDAQGTDCNVYDSSPGVMKFYVVHVRKTGATAAWFAAPQPPCLSTAVYLYDTPVFPTTIGNSQTGVEIQYGDCLSSPIHILTIEYGRLGQTGSCCRYPVISHPDKDGIKIEDCDSVVFTATGGQAIVNPTPSCSCNVPVKETTWGKIKAQYR